MYNDLTKRIITSFFLFFILIFSFINNYLLSTILIFLSILSFFEFKRLINKIFNNFSTNSIILKIIFLFLSIIYLIFFSTTIWHFFNVSELKILILYYFLVCIVTDIGGLTFGRLFKGKKLTSISPNKTYSGLIGAYFFSFLLLLIFFNILNFKIYQISLVTFLTCSFAQLGDLFISFLKRKANLKDTGSILPGHGGILDRIDGILIGVPVGIFSSILFIL